MLDSPIWARILNLGWHLQSGLQSLVWTVKIFGSKYYYGLLDGRIHLKLPTLSYCHQQCHRSVRLSVQLRVLHFVTCDVDLRCNSRVTLPLVLNLAAVICIQAM